MTQQEKVDILKTNSIDICKYPLSKIFEVPDNFDEIANKLFSLGEIHVLKANENTILSKHKIWVATLNTNLQTSYSKKDIMETIHLALAKGNHVYIYTYLQTSKVGSLRYENPESDDCPKYHLDWVSHKPIKDSIILPTHLI